MTKAENFTMRVDGDLKARMDAHPEINWSHVIREHVRTVLDDLERMDHLAAESQLSEADVEDLAARIDAAAAERADEDRDATESESDDSEDSPAVDASGGTDLDAR